MLLVMVDVAIDPALIDVCQETTADAFFLCLLVGQYALIRGQDQEPEILAGQELGFPSLDVHLLDGEPWLDALALVDVAQQLDLEGATFPVIDEFHHADVSLLHHHPQDLADQLRRGMDEHVVDAPGVLGVVYDR